MTLTIILDPLTTMVCAAIFVALPTIANLFKK